MRKILMLTMAFVVLTPVINAQTSAATTSDGKTPAANASMYPEMPSWTRQLRRAEIITFGAFPFAFFLSTFVVDTIRWGSNGWNTRYAPWPIKSAGAIPMEDEQYGMTIGIAVGVSVTIALVDFLILKIRQRKVVKKQEGRMSPPPDIQRKPLFEIQTDDAPATDDAVQPVN
jgi:hypothetical protein